ncbi:MAG TPA: hypothetical protein VJU78_16145 [Chitinophagaceae bacterium]|nr:hypothetical protein [Chitinophagaceae bacterium]
MKKITTICLIATIFFAACKKDKEETANTLVGKWTIENTIIKEYVNNNLVNTDTEPGNGATMDFQNNGHVVITSPGNPIESLDYEIKSASDVEIDGDRFEIRNLNKSSVSLYLRQDYLPGEYDEVLINLKN